MIKIYNTVVLSVVLYGCKNSFLTNCVCVKSMVLGRIFGANRDEVTGDYRELRNEELQQIL
jgi:hypothetical protein